jgi:pimeloyl-ACP methyl ester carboxylesterase
LRKNCHFPAIEDLVIPGAGRDGDEYRDAWIDVAEASSVLVAGLTCPEADYDFAAYQMGGVTKDLVIRNMPLGPNGQMPDVMHQRDEDISFTISNRPDERIFDDLDRNFGLIAAASKSSQTTYDAFGHSAGGQILHRLALFHPRPKVNRIIAANAGLYTQPDLALTQPAGMKDSGVTADGLRAAFAEHFTLLPGRTRQ